MDIKKNKETVHHDEANSKLVHHWFLGGYALFAIGLGTLYFLLKHHQIPLPEFLNPQIITRLTLGLACCSVLLFMSRMLEKLLRRNAHSRADRYNIIRVVRLVTFVLIVLIIISFVNANWYTAAVSLGLMSLLLGFALQTPISSLIGWIYIILRIPFRVGDRIQIGTFTGDVVEIGYLDTTLWEFAGDYITHDLPSGRLIRFPNSMVFNFQVYNYSWHKFPYIWNEIPFHVAYDSDLNYVEERIRAIAKDELGTEMEEKVKMLRQVISETPIDEMEIKEYPFVNFRINPNTWVEVLLIYLVEPKQSGAVRSRLIKKILEDFVKEPRKVMFPNSNAR